MKTTAERPIAQRPPWHAAQKHVAVYALIVGVPVLVIILGWWLASGWFEAGALPSAQPHSAASRGLYHLLISLTAVVVIGRLMGALFVRLGQPKVLGEIVGGIALGPSLLGAFAPAASTQLIAPATLPILQSIGQLGLILFMFLVGLEFDFGLIRRKRHVAVLVSHASISIPFLGGAALGLYLCSTIYRDSVPPLSFTLFMGLAMSVTAFPVLTRILRDRKIQGTPLGTMAVACAAADDITAWCLLEVLLGATSADWSSGLTNVAATMLFCLVMWGVVRPLAKRLAYAGDHSNVATLLLGLLCSALMAEWIGVHAFFGAFLFGLCVPRDAATIGALKARLDDPTNYLLMPAFFVSSGMRTEFGLIDGWEGWLVCGLVIAVATAGKLIGTCTAARVAGLGWTEAVSLGVLLNTRGLMEIVIANIALECGIIPPQIFTALVIMALVTTAAAGPLLNLIGRLQRRAGATLG